MRRCVARRACGQGSWCIRCGGVALLWESDSGLRLKVCGKLGERGPGFLGIGREAADEVGRLLADLRGDPGCEASEEEGEGGEDDEDCLLTVQLAPLQPDDHWLQEVGENSCDGEGDEDRLKEGDDLGHQIDEPHDQGTHHR